MENSANRLDAVVIKLGLRTFSCELLQTWQCHVTHWQANISYLRLFVLRWQSEGANDGIEHTDRMDNWIVILGHYDENYMKYRKTPEHAPSAPRWREPRDG
jgi:hypothetical protein